MQDDYDTHKWNKILSQYLKDHKTITLDHKEGNVACVDLQKVLTTLHPIMSDFCYKSLYWAYNFTVFDIENHQEFCYV